MALLDDVKLALRVSSDAFDDEVAALVAAALVDMKRTGVREELLDPASPTPLAKMAVTLYAKALFGYDNPEAQRFMDSYRQTVADLLNSSANECDDESETYGTTSYYANAVLDAILPKEEG